MKKFLCLYMALSLIFSISIPYINLNTHTHTVYAASLFETISDVITEVGEGVFNTITAVNDLGSEAATSIVGTVVGNTLLNAGIITDSSTIQTIAENIINDSNGINLFQLVDGVLSLTSDGAEAIANNLNTVAVSTGIIGYARTNAWCGENFSVSAPAPPDLSSVTAHKSYAYQFGSWSVWGGVVYPAGVSDSGVVDTSTYINQAYVFSAVNKNNASNLSAYYYPYAYNPSTAAWTSKSRTSWGALTGAFVGEFPIFGSYQGMVDYYAGSCGYYGDSSAIRDVSVLSNNSIPITTVMNDSFNTLVTNISENNYTFNDITTITNEYVTIINNFAPTEDLTELLDYVVAIYNMLKAEFDHQLTDAEIEDISALIPDAATTYIVPSEISDQGSPSDFWSTLFSSRWAILLLLFPLGLAAAAYVIFGK